MRFKTLALIILALAMTDAGSLMAQADSTAAKKIMDPNSPQANSWRKNKRAAKKLLKKGQSEAAIPYLEAGLKTKPKKKYFAQKLAPAELAVRNYKDANKYYQLLVSKDSVKHKKPEYIFYYALTQKYLGQYEAAMATFARFRKLAKDNDDDTELKKRAIRESEGCEKGIFFRDSVPNPAFKIKHLDANINQPLIDFSPKLVGDNLYYSSVKGDKGLARIYKSMKQGKDWGAGVEISDNINIAGQNIGNPSFTPDGSTMYYTVCPPAGSPSTKCQIYKSTLSNGVWDKGVSIGAAVNDPLYDNTQPAVGLNKDGESVLYFVSDRNPGKGKDIFYAKINPDGTVAKPHSAGPQINSKGDEMSPFFDFKSKTLYFSSNGWINIGGMDVYKTTWDANGEWTEPENMGMPINSSTDDMDFSINEKNTLGFVVSNRPGGFGLKSETCCDDIYEVETTKLFLAARGNVYEEKDGVRSLAASGLVVLYDEKNGTEIGSYNLINGSFFFDLQPKGSYRLLSRKDGYYDAVAPFSTDYNTESDTMKYDLFLKKKPEPVAENPLMGRGIGRLYYDYDQSRLRADARDSLRKVLDVMNQYPNIVVEVGAHTDARGSEAYNLALSKKRADAVVNYYINEKKIARDRLVAKSYGSSEPVASDKTPDGKDNPAGRALNRRTEFKVIGEINPNDKKETEAIKASPPAKVVKKDMKGKVIPEPKPAPAPKKDQKTTSQNITYKTAPTPAVVTGMVYMEKAGKRTLVSQAAVFLTSNEGGFQQRVYYVKGDGSYSFDLSRAAADTFRLIARKYQFESDEVVFTPDDVRTSNRPIDLVIKMK